MLTARDKIRELRALHEDGLLSQQEFDSRKNAILDAEYAPPGGRYTPIHIPSVASAATTEIGLMAGMEIGPQNRRYRLERLIATGGMGQVWEALDLATHAELGHSATVALKILPPHLTRSPSHARLLIEEATQARQLAHEHIVRVYEWARDPATASYFIIMEHLEGEDLDSLLQREGKLAAARALGLLEPVAHALDYAWDKAKLVHRDIKPGNVFVTSTGQVKLLDFGIAARARGGAGLEAPQDSGTDGYRAPEAGAAKRQPARTLDVYSVSVMLVQMLTGERPSMADAAKPEALNERQWQVLQRALSSHAESRPASVRALLDALVGAEGPTEQELEEQKRAARAREEAKQRELAAQRRAQAEAAAAARLEQDRQRKEQRAREKAEAEAAREARKEILRRQLLERRELEAAKARAAREETLRKAAQARAAAAYRAEQARSREQKPAGTIDGPAVADPEGVLRDRFLDGSAEGPELVLIPTGRFRMGSPEHERKKAQQAGALPTWLERETPQRWVAVERPFALGRSPVTVGEWRAFVQDTGWQRRGEVDWAAPGFSQSDEHPVVGVSWHDAQLYAEWLSHRTGQAYRLPTEAEWEYACRAGTASAFSCGDTISTELANYDGNYSYHGSPPGAFRRGTTPVRSFPPNPWGLFDMHGNVWEWVQDPVHENYAGAPATAVVWEEGGDPNRRILRGGSWQYSPRYLRSAMRNGFAAGLCNDIVGFRVAREL